MKLRHWVIGCLNGVVFGLLLDFTAETMLLGLIINLIIGMIIEIVTDRGEKRK